MDSKNRKIRFKRRKYFLKESPQPRLIAMTYIILLSVIVVSGAVFYLVANKDLTNEFYQAHSTIKSTMELLLPALIIINIGALTASVFLVIRFTHGIAGPIYQLRQLADQISGGDLSVNVKFRKGDHVGELADILNSILLGLRERLQRLNEASRNLENVTQNLDQNSDLDSDKLRKELLSVQEELKAVLTAFKV